MKVLFATDGSPSSSRAQDLVASIGWPSPTDIEVLHVDQLQIEDLELPADTLSPLHEKIRAQIRVQLAAAKRALEGPGRDVEVRMVLGRPASAIADEARRLAADVIVLGSRGHSAFASALLGSVAAEVVDHAPCPVLVARTAALTGTVLAHDGSDGARQAEQLVATWPFLRALPVRVVSVWNIDPGYAALDPVGGVIDPDVYQQIVDDLKKERQTITAEAVKRLAAMGIRASAEVRDGGPVQQLIAAAREARADLIVVGSRGRTGLARLVLGSVARGVLFHAPCSVLITRQRAER
jgi:nucleotide-binding universal stress UspA family protein